MFFASYNMFSGREERRGFSGRAMPPDVLACHFVPLHCETLDDGTAERERERGLSPYIIALAKERERERCICVCVCK